MTLPSSGALQFSAINTELCLPSNTTLGLNDNGARALAAKPTPASQIAASDFYGKTGLAKYIAVAHNDSPYLSVYAFDEDFGFGPKLADPSTLPYNDGICVDIKSDKSVVIVGHNDGGSGYPDFFSAYPLSCNGLGAKYAAPAGILPDIAYGVRFSPNGSYVAIGKNDSPRVLVYPWSSGFGTKYADPATSLPGGVNAVAFSPANNAIAMVTSVSAYIHAYRWSSSGFGTKYSNPASLPPGGCVDIKFSPNGSSVAVMSDTSPYVAVYPWNYTTGFGTKYANPSPALTGDGGDGSVAFSPNSNVIVMGTGNKGSLIYAYKWNPGFGTKYDDPATLPEGTVWSIAFSASGSTVVASHSYGDHISAYPWNYTTGFGARYANPITVGAAYGVAFGG